MSNPLPEDAGEPQNDQKKMDHSEQQSQPQSQPQSQSQPQAQPQAQPQPPETPEFCFGTTMFVTSRCLANLLATMSETPVPPIHPSRETSRAEFSGASCLLGRYQALFERCKRGGSQSAVSSEYCGCKEMYTVHWSDLTQISPV